jgi:hypothetical protein
MPRSHRPELWLLLAVTPLFAACDDGGPEERHCVGPDGAYTGDWGCEPAHPSYRGGSHFIYVPMHHYTGVGTQAGLFARATSPGSGKAMVTRGGFGDAGSSHAHGGS